MCHKHQNGLYCKAKYVRMADRIKCLKFWGYCFSVDLLCHSEDKINSKSCSTSGWFSWWFLSYDIRSMKGLIWVSKHVKLSLLEGAIFSFLEGGWYKAIRNVYMNVDLLTLLSERKSAKNKHRKKIRRRIRYRIGWRYMKRLLPRAVVWDRVHHSPLGMRCALDVTDHLLMFV